MPFTNVRVEATGQGSTKLRWDYDAVADVGIYRSTDGSSYSLVTTVDNLIEEYDDTGLANKTKYWYKLSDDVGSTFSSVVTVVTHVIRSKHQGNASRFAPGLDGDFALTTVGGAVANEITSQTQSQPCGLCIVDGAIVIDCTSGCDWFQVVVDQDINSISLLGCDDCPNVDFVIPPDTERGICGWPSGCDYFGDECFQGPIPGGPNGRTAKTNGLSYDGYGPPPGLSPSDCQCPPSTELSIKCCEDSCVLDCADNSSVRLRACGGLAPYEWSVTGSATLSSSTGTRTTVSVNQSGGTPGQAAFLINGMMRAQWYDNGNCGGGGNLGEGTISSLLRGTVVDCFGDPTGGTSTGLTSLSATIDRCGGGTGNLTLPDASIHSQVGFPLHQADVTVSIHIASSPSLANEYNGSATLGQTAVSTFEDNPLTPSTIDLRTQDMIDDGCVDCSDLGEILVTLTDAAGVSVSESLAA
jgi:hypothetical protein